MYDATVVDENGRTPWFKRFQVDAPFKVYPWGALVMVKSLTDKKGKFVPKMTAHMLAGVSFGPGCVWDHTYFVDKLSKRERD